jgi:hypothetical protein
VHDPQIFNELKDGIVNHVTQLANCHLCICDQENILTRDLLTFLNQASENTKKYMGAFLTDARIVRIKHDEQLFSVILEAWPDYPGSAMALTLSRHDKIDLILASSDTLVAMALLNIQDSRIMSLAQYGDNKELKDREYSCMGSRAIKDMPEEEFCESIIAPFVKWSKKIILIDRWLLKAQFNEQPNWDNFKRTIRLIYKTWESVCAVERNKFEIITFPCTYIKPDDPDKEAKRKKMPDQQNIFINDLCRKDISEKYLSVKLKKINPTDREDKETHDRFLMTSQGMVLNITTGFDLIHLNKIVCASISINKGNEKIINDMQYRKPWEPLNSDRLR